MLELLIDCHDVGSKQSDLQKGINIFESYCKILIKISPILPVSLIMSKKDLTLYKMINSISDNYIISQVAKKSTFMV